MAQNQSLLSGDIVQVCGGETELLNYLFRVIAVRDGTVFLQELPRPSDKYGDPPRGACLRSYHVDRADVVPVVQVRFQA